MSTEENTEKISIVIPLELENVLNHVKESHFFDKTEEEMLKALIALGLENNLGIHLD